MDNSKMKLNLKIWRQKNAQSKGRMVPTLKTMFFTTCPFWKSSMSGALGGFW